MSTGMDNRLLNSIWIVLSSPSATTVIKFLPRDSSLARLSYGLKNVRMDSFTFTVKPAALVRSRRRCDSDCHIFIQYIYRYV